MHAGEGRIHDFDALVIPGGYAPDKYISSFVGFAPVSDPRLVIAVMMQRLTRRTWLRGVVLTPYLVSNVVAAMVFLWMLDFQLGIGNRVIGLIGLDRIAFLADSAWVIPTIALINVWRHVGYTALLIFAGLQTIPETVYEAGARHRLPTRSSWTAPVRSPCSAGSPCRCCARSWPWF